ncbi:unnamed protein product [Symbiodinium sp. CCMP2592]|nr:unnamed protein product [Symbiodinium sp. CCMP2592]
MSQLCSEVQAWIHKDAADMRRLADPAMPATSVEEVWLKVLEVWGHFAREHLPYMLRMGFDPSELGDFLKQSQRLGFGGPELVWLQRDLVKARVAQSRRSD